MTYDELQRIRKLSEYITDQEERIERLQSQIEKITATINQNASTGQKFARDRMADDIAVLLDMKTELLYAIIDKKQKIQEVKAQIEKLPWEQCRLMSLRYLDGLSWRIVSDRMHYDIRSCFKIHRKALHSLGII